MAAISSILSSSPNFTQSTKPFTTTHQQLSNLSLFFNSNPPQISPLKFSPIVSNTREFRRISAVAAGNVVTKQDPSSVAARRLYVGNIPRTVNNDELQGIVQEHGAVEKVEVMYDKYSGRSRRFAFVTMKTVEDANAAVEKLNGTQIGGRDIKVNVTEKPLAQLDFSILQSEDSKFVDSPYKLYVGNLSKTATSDSLKRFFAKKAKVLSAKISRVPGTSKSSGFGFVTFSSEEEVEAAIKDFNNAMFEGQKVRVNKA